MNNSKTDIASTFTQSAWEPVRTASAHISAGRIAEGFESLSHENLAAGIQKAAERIAGRLGVTSRDVQNELPLGEIMATLERIGPSRLAATDAWRKHADCVGGLLLGFRGGTVVSDVRKQSAGEYLINLAGRFIRDKELAEPLRAFATDILEWEALLCRAGETLAQGKLATVFERRRRLRLFLRIAGSFILLSAIAGFGIHWRALSASRARIQNVLGLADPCAVETISPEDARHATESQVRSIQEQKAECEKRRAIERREASCESLAKHIEDGQLSAQDEVLAGPAAAVLGRAANRTLEAPDLLFQAMPCQDSKTDRRLWRAFAKAAFTSPSAWVEATRISNELAKLLAEKDATLSAEASSVITRRAENAAEKAIIDGRSDLLSHARALCDFQASLKLLLGRHCSGVIFVTGSAASPASVSSHR